MQVKYDRKLLIAIGRSRKASQWQNKEMLWSEFLDKLATTTRTRETVAEYAAMPKGERDTIRSVILYVISRRHVVRRRKEVHFAG